VLVAVLPRIDAGPGYVAPDRITLSAELKQRVEKELNARRLLGTKLEVIPPQYFWVSVEAKLRIADRGDPAVAADARRRAEAELYRYLNPYHGGPNRTGWPFGRDLHVSELYALLQRLDGVEFVDDLRILVRDVATGAAPVPAPPRLTIPPHGLICSDAHRVNRS
jgi:hypothetical protein